MRARDSKRQADELAAVVRWLRAQTDAMSEASETLGRRPELAQHAAAFWQRSHALREAADALERGEHHDAR